jgi:deoxyribonuclease-4
LLLGAHESTSGGLHQAFGRAVLDGAETVQIFTKSSRMWRAKEITPEDAKLFRAEAQRTGFGRHTSVHASYLINLGSAPGDLREKSVAAFIDELQRCDVLGVPFLIVHPGSNSDTEQGLRLIADGLDRTFAAHKGHCIVLLETAAGQGNALGRTFEELRTIREQMKSPKRLAVCLDTCHVFAAGYDLTTDRAYDETFARFDEVLGLELLKAFHLNDSVKPLGCRVDRHERVCEGEIGETCFRRLVNDPRFEEVPGYLEIPPEGNKPCLARLRKLRATEAKVPAGAAAKGAVKTQTGSGRKRPSRVARGPRSD